MLTDKTESHVSNIEQNPQNKGFKALDPVKAKDLRERFITTKLIKAYTLASLLGVIDKFWDEFNSIHICTALNILAKLYRNQNQSKNKTRKSNDLPPRKQSMQKYLFKLLNSDKFDVLKFEPRNLTDFAWAISIFCYGEQPLLHKVPVVIDKIANKAISTKFSDFKPKEISIFAWSMIKLGYRNETLFKTIADIVLISKLKDYDPQSLVNLSFVFIEILDAQTRQSIYNIIAAQTLLLGLKKFNIFEIGSLATNFANANQYQKELFDAIQSWLLTRSQNEIVTNSLADIAIAFAKNGCHSKNLFDHIIRIASDKEIMIFSTKQLLTLANAFMIANYYKPHFFQSIIDVLATRVFHPNDRDILIKFKTFCNQISHPFVWDPELLKSLKNMENAQKDRQRGMPQKGAMVTTALDDKSKDQSKDNSKDKSNVIKPPLCLGDKVPEIQKTKNNVTENSTIKTITFSIDKSLNSSKPNNTIDTVDTVRIKGPDAEKVPVVEFESLFQNPPYSQQASQRSDTALSFRSEQLDDAVLYKSIYKNEPKKSSVKPQIPYVLFSFNGTNSQRSNNGNTELYSTLSLKDNVRNQIFKE